MCKVPVFRRRKRVVGGGVVALAVDDVVPVLVYLYKTNSRFVVSLFGSVLTTTQRPNSIVSFKYAASEGRRTRSIGIVYEMPAAARTAGRRNVRCLSPKANVSTTSQRYTGRPSMTQTL
jgi:hypothetical protein